MSVLTKEKKDWTGKEWKELVKFIQLKVKLGKGESYGSVIVLAEDEASIEVLPEEVNTTGTCYYVETLYEISKVFGLMMMFTTEKRNDKIVTKIRLI